MLTYVNHNPKTSPQSAIESLCYQLESPRHWRAMTDCYLVDCTELTLACSWQTALLDGRRKLRPTLPNLNVYLRLSVDDDHKTVWLVKVVKQLNNTINVSNKLQQVNF